ncbi:dihydroorotase [Pseudahrensia aquimaris]|uniref:Dihydroorotase n=1 Tax=Pseudahrensia aquimaris TaxID=744461 RepID=A0ABW3FMU5_9HYPH
MNQRHFINARVIDPASGFDGPGEVLVEGDKITAVAKSVDKSSLKKNVKAIDCSGFVLAPGLVDTRVFVGEPGTEYRETIASAAEAAAAGGVTSFVMMPDTDPPIDDVALVEFVRRTATDTAKVHVYPTAAVTRALKGTEMTEMGLLSQAGAVAFTDGRNTIENAAVFRRALQYARDFDALIMATTQEKTLSGSGVMHSGANATRMGLSGIPQEAELIALERDMRLVAMTGGKYHAATLSAAQSLDIVRKAKSDGLDVTAGVAIANLSLNENDIGSYRTFFRVSPPLRGEDDRLALVEGVRDGTIDVICSNHDPQDVDTKRHPFAEAEDGAVGLETLLAASLRLHHSSDIPLTRLLHCLSTGPANRLGLPSGRIAPGAPADLILFDPDHPWVVSEDDLRSRSKNTAFEGARMMGRVLKTWVGGRKVFSL